MDRREKPVPRPNIHLRLAERMRRDVIPFHDGWLLGSARDLASHYGAAPNTIRKALAILAEQGQIARTEAGRYVRKRPNQRQIFCKPYPAVALLSYWSTSLVGQSYLATLMGSFLGTLGARGLPACLMPSASQVQIQTVPEGAIIGPAEMRFSAVAFRSAAPTAMLERLIATGAIVMVLDALSTVEGVDSAAVDCEHEAARATDYLVGLGHRHIGFLAHKDARGSDQWHDRTDPDVHRFSAAMLATKQRLGLNASPDYHVVYDFDATHSDAGVRQAVDRLWRLRPVPTALACFDPGIAEKVEQILSQRGLTCPSHVSLLVRDMATPGPRRYTSLVSDPTQIGRAAADHIANRLISTASKAARLLFPSVLAEGETTLPRPAT